MKISFLSKVIRPANGRLFRFWPGCGRLWLWCHGCWAGRPRKSTTVNTSRRHFVGRLRSVEVYYAYCTVCITLMHKPVKTYPGNMGRYMIGYWITLYSWHVANVFLNYWTKWCLRFIQIIGRSQVVWDTINFHELHFLFGMRWWGSEVTHVSLSTFVFYNMKENPSSLRLRTGSNRQIYTYLWCRWGWGPERHMMRCSRRDFTSQQGGTQGGEGPPWDLKNTVFSGFLPLHYVICFFEVRFFKFFCYVGGLRKPAAW